MMSIRSACFKLGTMFFQRRILVRASVFLNFCVLTYVALQAVQSSSSRFSSSISSSVISVPDIGPQNEGPPGSTIDSEVPTSSLGSTESDSSPTTPESSVTVTYPQNEYLEIPCTNKKPSFSYTQRGIFWILNNYIKADRYYACNESITYTTHGDVTFLDNVLPLVKRWEGPISLAVYTPGSDYDFALTSIDYLRRCADPSIRQRVTFHIILDMRHFPKSIHKFHHIQGMNNTSKDLPEADCFQPAPWEVLRDDHVTYKTLKNLTYPVNVLRNVARENAQTHYVLASDAELYPSPNLVTEFFQMIRRNDSVLNMNRPKVFVLPIFEVYGNQTVPESKAELVSKLKTGMAIPFHKKVCSYCHSIPKSKEWVTANISEGLRVFHVAKRHKPYDRWEPIYIGTQQDPLYDERLSWEGKSDKMTQGYALCALDYDFMILDNAFLVHRPGVKLYKKDPTRDAYARKQSSLIRYTILKELKLMYGSKPDCVL